MTTSPGSDRMSAMGMFSIADELEQEIERLEAALWEASQEVRYLKEELDGLYKEAAEHEAYLAHVNAQIAEALQDEAEERRQEES